MTKAISSAKRKPRALKHPWASMSTSEWQAYFLGAYAALGAILGRALTGEERAEFRAFLDSYLHKNGMLGANPADMATVYNACGDWFKYPHLAPDHVGKAAVRDPKAKARADAAKAARKGAR